VNENLINTLLFVLAHVVTEQFEITHLEQHVKHILRDLLFSLSVDKIVKIS
jgi:hypothetical protein